MNPPIRANKSAIFKCTACTGAPFGIEKFLWIHVTLFHTKVDVSKVKVPYVNKCYTRTESIKTYVINVEDIGKANITCHVSGTVRTIRILRTAGKLIFFLLPTLKLLYILPLLCLIQH